jgi:hypothetical protein
MVVGRWGEGKMEVVLALIIGCAVASVVFVLGRAFIGSGSVSEKVQDLPEFLSSASESLAEAVSDADKTINQTEPARRAEPLLEHPPAIEPKKVRRASAAKKATPTRRRKTTGRPVPGVNVVQ